MQAAQRQERTRIVVLDGATLNPGYRVGESPGDNPWDEVAALGELLVYDRTPPASVLERAAGATVLLVNKTPLAAASIRALPALRLIAVTATGTNVVDIEAAASCAVAVCNVPEYATDSVAQHVFALLLEITNAVGEHASAVRAGRWQRSENFCFWTRPTSELAGKTMGIVGHGLIGSRVGELAHAFGMKVLASSPSRSRPAGYASFEWATTDRVFAESDVVSLHCPLTRDSAAFVNADLLARMKPQSILINTSRGALIDEQALAAALASGRPAAAALDVLSVEPARDDNPLLAAPGAVITPHMAWSTLAARQRLMHESAVNVAAFLHGRPRNLVTPAPTRSATATDD
ncbi:MAG: D-2-hydroxyacid dehydrogenase [Deltaproteobacteria bacterium]|nr:D-2-hydroxyacid dehydrogenase [Deltaproteobacteria bacterium]